MVVLAFLSLGKYFGWQVVKATRLRMGFRVWNLNGWGIKIARFSNKGRNIWLLQVLAGMNQSCELERGSELEYCELRANGRECYIPIHVHLYLVGLTTILTQSSRVTDRYPKIADCT